MKIAGSISLGSRVEAGGKLTSVTVGGSVQGSILSGSDAGSVVVRGDVVGSAFNTTGYIHSGAGLKSVVIGGSLIGPTLNSATNLNVSNSGEISAVGALGTVLIGGDLIGGTNLTNGGSLTDSGVILAQRIGAVTVGGSIIGGDYTLSSTITRGGAIIAENDIGTITVKGSILGTPSNISPRVPVLIIARGAVTPTATADLAIKSISVSGSVVGTNILAGFSKTQLGLNADAQIGALKIGGDWISSYAIAGIDPADGVVGNGNEFKLTGDYGLGPVKDTSAIVSAIASITIGGAVQGDRGTNSAIYGFGAEQIGAFKNGTTVFPLKPGPHNDTFGGTPTTGIALPIGASQSFSQTDGFAVHVFEM